MTRPIGRFTCVVPLVLLLLGGASRLAAQSFTDDPLVIGQTPIKAVHITELRSRIDTQRVRVGLSAFPWTESIVAGQTVIRAAQFLELRTAARDAAVALGLTAPTYADAIAAGVVIRASHVTELRQTVRTLESTALCHTTVTPSHVDVASGGGPITFHVQTGTNCTWSADSGASWVSRTSAATGSGIGDVTYAAAAYALVTARAASWTIAGQAVTVAQSATIPWATTLLLDQFTAGDGTTLTDHVPDVALAHGTWSVSGPGYYAPHATIYGQRLTQDDPEGSGGDYRQATIDAGTADGVIGVDWFPATSPAFTPASGLVFRKVDERNFWYVGSWAGSPISVWRVVDDYWGDPVTVATAIDQTQPHRLEAMLNGPSITVQVDGAAIAQLTDAFAVTGHVHGVHWWTGYEVTSAFDNFSVTGSLGCVTAVSSTTLSAAGGSGGVTVTAPSGCAWTAMTDASWLTLTAPSGQGNGTVGFSAATNPGWMTRTGVVYINGRTTIVTQSGATPTDFSCEPSISPPSAAIDSNGKTDVFSVIVPDGCPWRVESMTAGWMHPDFYGSQQSRTVEYTVDTNASGAARGGAIYVRDLTYGVLRPFGIDQEGAAPGSGGGGSGGGGDSTIIARIVSSAGKTSAVATPDASATPTTDVPWLTATTDATTGVVTYSATAANPGTARTGHVLFGATILTIDQPASIFDDLTGWWCDPPPPACDPEGAGADCSYEQDYEESCYTVDSIPLRPAHVQFMTADVTTNHMLVWMRGDAQGWLAIRLDGPGMPTRTIGFRWGQRGYQSFTFDPYLADVQAGRYTRVIADWQVDPWPGGPIDWQADPSGAIIKSCNLALQSNDPCDEKSLPPPLPPVFEITSPTNFAQFPLSAGSSRATEAISFSVTPNASTIPIIWTADLSYATSGNRGAATQSDSFQTQPNSSTTRTYEARGGQIILRAFATINGTTAAATPVTFWVTGFAIPDGDITARLLSLYGGPTPNLLTGIASKESSYRQFAVSTLYGIQAKWPYESYDGGSHIGLMQVAATLQDAWDWHANTASGAALFAAKLSIAAGLESQIRSANAGLRALTDTERENMAVVLYGPYSHSLDVTMQYYIPRVTGASVDWVVNTENNSDGVAYANDVRGQVRQ